MGDVLTPETNARRVLEIFQHFDCKAGDVLWANNFVAVGSRLHWEMKELQTGLIYAFDRQWVEKSEDRGIRLTRAGFEAMQPHFAQAGE